MKLFSGKKVFEEENFKNLNFKKMSKSSKATIGGGFSIIGIVTGVTAIVNTASIALSYVTQLKESKLNSKNYIPPFPIQKNSFLFYESESFRGKNTILS